MYIYVYIHTFTYIYMHIFLFVFIHVVRSTLLQGWVGAALKGESAFCLPGSPSALNPVIEGFLATAACCRPSFTYSLSERCARLCCDCGSGNCPSRPHRAQLVELPMIGPSSKIGFNNPSGNNIHTHTQRTPAQERVRRERERERSHSALY